MTDNYFGQHLSLSGWARRANFSGAEDVVAEDGAKRSRLQMLAELAGAPIVVNTAFDAAEVLTASSRYREFKAAAGSTPFALRLSPLTQGGEVMRRRNESVAELESWFEGLGPAAEGYSLDFEPHIDSQRSVVLYVRDGRAFGEAIHGGIVNLSRGTHDAADTITFDCELGLARWTIEGADADLAELARETLDALRVSDPDVRRTLRDRLDAHFTDDYLVGYFEAIWSPSSGMRLIDYNRQLLASDTPRPAASTVEDEDPLDELTGRVGSPGLVSGRARVIDDPSQSSIEAGEILVCRLTSPDFVELMVRAAGIVTDVGGVLSHAAIICRELGIPCIVGTVDATTRIRTGDLVEIDSEAKVVRILRREGAQ